jgi:hypothetical protein
LLLAQGKCQAASIETGFFQDDRAALDFSETAALISKARRRSLASLRENPGKTGVSAPTGEFGMPCDMPIEDPPTLDGCSE